MYGRAVVGTDRESVSSGGYPGGAGQVKFCGAKTVSGEIDVEKVWETRWKYTRDSGAQKSGLHFPFRLKFACTDARDRERKRRIATRDHRFRFVSK